MRNEYTCLIIFLLFISVLHAATEKRISNPSMISYTESTFAKQGEIRAVNGKFFKLMLNLTVPQQTPYQNVSFMLPEESVLYDDKGNMLAYIEIYNKSYQYKYSIRAGISTASRHLLSLDEEYSVPNSYLAYVEPTEHSVITPAIESRAREITANYENDLDKIAALTIWVNEYITYDINELGKNKDSMSVYSDPKGVCVEYTNLLIALSRSLGYPTRSVLGYSYSPEYGWQLHSWAEVYLGEWVGVDPTWLEVGYIDATHIPIYFGKDTELADYASAYMLSDDASIQWLGHETLGTETQDIILQDFVAERMSYDLRSYPSELPIGGSGAIMLSIQSPGYRTYSVQVIPCSSNYDMIMFNDLSRKVFLHPGMNNIVFPYKISSSLDPNYIYSCPVTIAHDAGVDIVDIKITKNKLVGSKFLLTVPEYAGNEYTVRIAAKSSDNVFVATPHELSTVSLGKGDVYEFDVESDPFLEYVLVYDMDSSQPLLISYEGNQFLTSSEYSVDELIFSADVPSDRNGTLHLVLNISGKPVQYTAKVYVDDSLIYLEKSSSQHYVLDTSLPKLSEGKHKALVIIDFGFDEYKQDFQLNVFNPVITVHVVELNSTGNLYVFDVSGPYSYYDFYIDGVRIDPHKQRRLSEGAHTIQVEWIDRAGYARLHEQQIIVPDRSQDFPASTNLCPSLFAAISLLLILFYAKFNPWAE